MAQRCLSAAVLAILLAACAMGRELQQAAAPVEPISLARAASSDQASTDLNRQKLISSSNTGSVTATTLQPQSSQKRTLDQVNSDAPTITDPSTKVSVRPTASSQLLSSQAQTAPSLDTAQNTAQNAQTATAQAQSGGQQQVGVVNPYDVQGASPLDNNLITGDYVSQQQGIRIATPLFGTGYNFCIDRYISSFPRVGIVIPNPVVWLLPEFQDLASSLTTTLSLPNLVPHGAFVTPTSDGFLLFLPSIQPSEIPNFGIRYGIQIGQAFGYDFGYGILKDICSISFAIV